MDHTFWHKQTADKPLFENLLWSRPENKAHAGKILIIGGNTHGFSAPAQAYSHTLAAGAGTVRVVLPSSLQKTVGKVFEVGEYAPSTPSGSYSQQSLTELLSMSQWADAVLLSGDFGRNSETAIALENFCKHYRGPLILFGDSIDYFTQQPDDLLRREQTWLVPNFQQLQKIASSAEHITVFTTKLDFLHIIEALQHFSSTSKVGVTLEHENSVFNAFAGQVSSTKGANASELALASACTVWIAQNPTKPFEAATTAVIAKNN